MDFHRLAIGGRPRPREGGGPTRIIHLTAQVLPAADVDFPQALVGRISSPVIAARAAAVVYARDRSLEYSADGA